MFCGNLFQPEVKVDEAAEGEDKQLDEVSYIMISYMYLEGAMGLLYGLQGHHCHESIHSLGILVTKNGLQTLNNILQIIQR